MIFLSIRKKDDLLKVMSGSLIDLPSPSSLSFFWNFGSLLGLFLFFQILTGVFLSLQFSGSIYLSFDSVIHLVRDINYGWLLRVLHANGASFFFFFMYFHIGRGMYYGSYQFQKVWLSGSTIFILSMAAAFLGYVLPWGQMSFWAATVITNLLSAVPYLGVMLVEWVWGGFSVGNSTLTRFFAFHFLLPFIILFFVLLHLLFLHKEGSSNPLGSNSNFDKVMFHPYFSLKDLLGYLVWGLFYMTVCFLLPYIFMDVENFIPSNPMVTPVHIQPEWYFLFVYAILRSVPSKIGGVVALLGAVLVLFFFPFVFDRNLSSTYFYPFVKFSFWVFVVNMIMLTWIGVCEVESPYMELGKVFSFLYFFLYLEFWLCYSIQDFFI